MLIITIKINLILQYYLLEVLFKSSVHLAIIMKMSAAFIYTN